MNAKETLAKLSLLLPGRELLCGRLDLHGADLTLELLCGRLDLHEANLTGANLSGADLSGANLHGADLTGADLTWSDLAGSDLVNANLSGANLHGANLHEADLTGANLTGADLANVNLSGADLTWSDLAGSDLVNANLSGANLRRADLRGASRLSWDDHMLLGEILARQATTLEQRKIAALVMTGGRFDMCWSSYLSELPKDDIEWALSVLAEAANPNDPYIPGVVRERMAHE